MYTSLPATLVTTSGASRPKRSSTKAVSGAGVPWGSSLDVKAALAVEVGAGDSRDDAVGIGVLMAENDGGHCDEAFLQNGEMQAFPEEYADGMFNLTIVGELQAP